MQVLVTIRSKQVEVLKIQHERLFQEKAMRELTEEAKRSSEALKTKCALVRHIGHEIRTPLNVVGVGVDLLIKDLAPHAAVLPDGVMDIVYGTLIHIKPYYIKPSSYLLSTHIFYLY